MAKRDRSDTRLVRVPAVVADELEEIQRRTHRTASLGQLIRELVEQRLSEIRRRPPELDNGLG